MWVLCSFTFSKGAPPLQRPPDASLLFGAVFGDPAPVSFGERAPESSVVKIAAVSRRSGLLPPGVVQSATVERVEAKIVDEAKHCCLGVRRIAGDRESDPPPRSPRNALLEKALGEDVVERLDHGTPDLLRDPLAVEHAPVDRIDVAIAKLGMVVADIDYDDAARYVRKQPPRKISDGLRWDRNDDDFYGFGGVDNGNGRRADLGTGCPAKALAGAKTNPQDGWPGTQPGNAAACLT
jgi:hypothetical protein